MIARVDPATAESYRAAGWWPDRPLGATIHRRAAENPEGIAYLDSVGATTWARYDAEATLLASRLVGLGIPPGARVAVLLPDGADQHIAYTAGERAGVVVVAIPERAGDRELAHLLRLTGAVMAIGTPMRRGRPLADVIAAMRSQGASLAWHAEGGRDRGWTAFRWPDGPGHRNATGEAAGAGPVRCDDVAADPAGRELSADDLWLLNSTSGTTGLPKCVEQTQNRWAFFVALAREAAGLSADDVLMSVVPGPFGFGLWTAHFSPPLLGARCVLDERFDAASTLRSVARHRVSVLACVTTQWRMMLASPVIDEVDLSSLRVLYTGGERVPPEQARQWERRTGSIVLQFYGANESGPFSYTSRSDPEQLRLSTVGRVAPGVDVRLFGEADRVVTTPGEPGQPGVRGPGVCGGYYGDPAADAALYAADGYLLLPDLVTIGEDGYVRIAGRKSDLIIRGGKNISAAAVEAEVGAHPAVDMVAAIAVPDPMFGERVCAVVTLRPGAPRPDLAELVSFLTGRGVGPESLPEHLVVLDEMPVSMGEKIAKQELRTRIPAMLGLPADPRPPDHPERADAG